MGFVMLEVYYGLGRHKDFIHRDKYVAFLKYNYLDWCQVFITLATSKIAFCLFLLRISKFERWRNFMYGMIAFLVLSHLPITFLYIFQCRPVNKVWDTQVPGDCWPMATIEKIIIIQGGESQQTTCLNYINSLLAHFYNVFDDYKVYPNIFRVCSIVTDVIGAAFPILLLRNMKLPRRQRHALSLLMGLGIITAITCIIRTVLSYEVKADDQSWEGVPNALCRILEVNFGIIAACMPMMRSIWKWGKKKWGERVGPASVTTTKTPMSRLQWYTPHTLAPWYVRIKRHFQQKPDPPVSLASSTQSTDRCLTYGNNERSRFGVSRPNIPPVIPRPIPKSNRPQHYERPANATWAKDTLMPKTSDSLDLPLQGVKNSDWTEDKESNSRMKIFDES
ncbi:MAG: hypothetical protein Q9163_006208 [Psora crenata]